MAVISDEEDLAIEYLSDTPEAAPTGRGPRGGDLENPVSHPDWRRADLNAVDGGLHRFPSKRDTAIPGIQKEQAWHYMAAVMLLAGRTNIEIAAAANCSPQEISNLRGQTWFQQRLSQLAHGTGAAVLAELESEALASVRKLVELRDGACGRKGEGVSLSAATTLLEHFKGKATATVLTKAEVSHKSPKDEYAEIEADLAALRKQREALTKPSITLPDPPSSATT